MRTSILVLLFLTLLFSFGSSVLYYDSESVYINSNVNILGDLTVRGGLFAKNLEQVFWNFDAQKNGIALIQRIFSPNLKSKLLVSIKGNILHYMYYNEKMQPIISSVQPTALNFQINLSTNILGYDSILSSYFSYFKQTIGYFDFGLGLPYPYSSSSKKRILVYTYRPNAEPGTESISIGQFYLFTHEYQRWTPLNLTAFADVTQDNVGLTTDENTCAFLKINGDSKTATIYQYDIIDTESSTEISLINTFNIENEPIAKPNRIIVSVNDNILSLYFSVQEDIGKSYLFLKNGLQYDINFNSKVKTSYPYLLKSHSIENQALITNQRELIIFTFSSFDPLVYIKDTISFTDDIYVAYFFTPSTIFTSFKDGLYIYSI